MHLLKVRLLLQCTTDFSPIALVESELLHSLILECFSGSFLIITRVILTSFWLEEFRFCTTESEMTFPAISSLASGHFRLPSGVFPFTAASDEMLKLPKFSLNVSLLLAAGFGFLLRVIGRKKNDFTSQKRTRAIIVLWPPPHRNYVHWLPSWSAVSVKIRLFYDNFREFL